MHFTSRGYFTDPFVWLLSIQYSFRFVGKCIPLVSRLCFSEHTMHITEAKNHLPPLLQEQSPQRESSKLLGSECLSLKSRSAGEAAIWILFRAVIPKQSCSTSTQIITSKPNFLIKCKKSQFTYDPNMSVE